MKHVTIILLIIVLIAAGVFGVLWYKANNEIKQMKIDHASQVKKLETDVADQEAKVTALTTDIVAVKQQVTQKETELAALKKEQMAAAKDLLDAKDQEITEAKAATEEVVAKNEAQVKQIETLQSTLDGKEGQVANLKQVIESKDKKALALNQTITVWKGKHTEMEELAEKMKNRLLENKIAVEPEKKFSGNILVVNKDQDFVIIDLGADDNLPVGKVLKVVRGTSYIGTLEVKKLLEQDGNLCYAIATKLVDPSKPIQEGDLVSNIIGVE
jgi:hypothetical protein